MSFNRRTVIKGAAWAAPAVALATTAPAFAASAAEPAQAAQVQLAISLLDAEPLRATVPSGLHPGWNGFAPIFFAITNLSTEPVPAGTVVTWTATVNSLGTGTWARDGGNAGTTFWRDEADPDYPAGSTFSVALSQTESSWPSNFNGQSTVLTQGSSYSLDVTLPGILPGATVNVTNGIDKGADPRAGDTVTATDVTMAVQVTSLPQGVTVSGPSGYSVPNLYVALVELKESMTTLN